MTRKSASGRHAVTECPEYTTPDSVESGGDYVYRNAESTLVTHVNQTDVNKTLRDCVTANKYLEAQSAARAEAEQKDREALERRKLERDLFFLENY